ncbi:MAG: WGR domain-containing protein [Hyphomicrobium sp.]|nr:WGR domain-containing protein [Hyphomicrobium sp.]
MARFYAMSVQPNLFGQWSLLREWGRIGSAGPTSAGLMLLRHGGRFLLRL